MMIAIHESTTFCLQLQLVGFEILKISTKIQEMFIHFLRLVGRQAGTVQVHVAGRYHRYCSQSQLHCLVHKFISIDIVACCSPRPPFFTWIPSAARLIELGMLLFISIGWRQITNALHSLSPE